MNDDPNVSCAGKAGYLSWDKARRAMSRGRFRDNDRGSRGRLKVYRCRHCAFWHIGRLAAGWRVR